MERGLRSIICSVGAVAVLAALPGCNGTNIDDPHSSDSLLIVEGVEPASVQADVSPDVDPNTLFVTPPADDTVTVKVKNLKRNQSASGVFGDILISSFDVSCSNGTLDSSNNPASLAVAAEATGDITVLVASGPFKQANSGALLAIGSDLCEITFNGQDLSGEPIVSTKAVFGVSFVDTP